MFTTHLMNREQRKSFESLYSSLANIEASIDAQNVQVKMPPPPLNDSNATRLQL